jgi:predicted amidohydrolase YtcJ
MHKLFILIFCLALISCNNQPEADAIYFNGKVYTVDSTLNIAEAFAVKDGKIIATGSNEEIKKYKSKTQTDLNGKFVYPGFIDAHCHFYGYGIDLKKIWLLGTKSFDEIVDSLQQHRDQLFMGWLFGRGWDQNDWTVKEYPDNTRLNELFPDVPVFLMRIDGHAALVNKKALDLAGVTESTTITGGEIIKKNGKLTGLLIDNAVDLVKNKIPEPGKDYKTDALLAAQKNCFAVGLTTVDDAGLEYEKIELIEELQQSGKIKMRMYAMITFDSANSAYYFSKGKIKTGRLNVSSFKLYADGALGSRGASLLQPYSDQHNHKGFLLKDVDSLRIVTNLVAEHGFQLNTHCIGDSANRLMLHLYHDALKGKKDHRWRIEHAQVVNPDDFKLFGEYEVIPSVQPAHATSDMYWAGDRLGNDRLKTAYAYRQLLDQNKMIAMGSDFPVEDINPLFGFYAAVARRDKKNFPPEKFQPENALTREEALRGMTIWAAYSNFEEKEKGSLEKGKYADFVILEDDIMTAPEEKLFSVKVLSTYINGEKVY